MYMYMRVLSYMCGCGNTNPRFHAFEKQRARCHTVCTLYIMYKYSTILNQTIPIVFYVVTLFTSFTRSLYCTKLVFKVEVLLKQDGGATYKVDNQQ